MSVVRRVTRRTPNLLSPQRIEEGFDTLKKFLFLLRCSITERIVLHAFVIGALVGNPSFGRSPAPNPSPTVKLQMERPEFLHAPPPRVLDVVVTNVPIGLIEQDSQFGAQSITSGLPAVVPVQKQGNYHGNSRTDERADQPRKKIGFWHTWTGFVIACSVAAIGVSMVMCGTVYLLTRRVYP